MTLLCPGKRALLPMCQCTTRGECARRPDWSRSLPGERGPKLDSVRGVELVADNLVRPERGPDFVVPTVDKNNCRPLAVGPRGRKGFVGNLVPGTICFWHLDKSSIPQVYRYCHRPPRAVGQSAARYAIVGGFALHKPAIAFTQSGIFAATADEEF